MDVSTAVQLDRLEEIERALAEIDPTQFVRADGPDPTVTKPGSFDEDESVEYGGASADSSFEPDFSAIVASDDRSSDHSNREENTDT